MREYFWSVFPLSHLDTIFGKGKLKTEIPRHNEIVNVLALKICKDLEIPDWRKK
jgi:hypothetical protein